jgi:hypothetical protein
MPRSARRTYAEGAGLAALLIVAMVLVGNLRAGAVLMPHRSYLPIVHRRPPGPLPAVADTMIMQGYPYTNFGSVDQMWVGYDGYLDPHGETVRSLVYFDISGLPPGTEILSASVRLYLVGSWDYPDMTRTITARRFRAEWCESSAIWYTLALNGDYFTTGSTDVTHGAWGWYDIDVTSLVQGWAYGSFANRGIMLRGPEEWGVHSSWKAFSTREGPFPPQLEITYVGSSGDTVTVLLQDGPAGEQAPSIDWTLLADVPLCEEGQTIKCLARFEP